MPVHVVIKRKLQMKKPETLMPLLAELSSRARQQPGYISSDILQRIDNPEEYLVVSKWESVDDWNNWFKSRERKDIQDQVDSLIGERTFYELFEPIK